NDLRVEPHREGRRGEDDWRRRMADDGALMRGQGATGRNMIVVHGAKDGLAIKRFVN
ncbi:hypothetical protein ACJX0J_012509, partial [Zea mays]